MTYVKGEKRRLPNKTLLPQADGARGGPQETHEQSQLYICAEPKRPSFRRADFCIGP